MYPFTFELLTTSNLQPPQPCFSQPSRHPSVYGRRSHGPRAPHWLRTARCDCYSPRFFFVREAKTFGGRADSQTQLRVRTDSAVAKNKPSGNQQTTGVRSPKRFIPGIFSFTAAVVAFFPSLQPSPTTYSNERPVIESTTAIDSLISQDAGWHASATFQTSNGNY